MLLAGIASERALGQNKPASRYDIFDIGEIPADPAWHDFRYTAFAINENNSVVGYLEIRVTPIEELLASALAIFGFETVADINEWLATADAESASNVLATIYEIVSSATP
ncbi:MAG: hypothetical protein SGJ09_01450 [Phycisphaerae bacterium]|nr:hypothetical protein [Phycisphaerae bacterium]